MANYDKKEVQDIFQRRDDLTEEEAKSQVEDLQAEVNDLLSMDCSYAEMEDLFLDYGLEMDYIMDFLL